MKKIVLVMILLVLVIGCQSKTTGKRVAIPEVSGKTSAVTGAVAGVEAAQQTAQTKTAAEALNEIKNTGSVTPISTGEKVGTFYPPITTDATGKEALKAKTRALFQQETYDPNVQATSDFGAKYHSSDGDPTNLPAGYDDNSGD